MWIKLTEAEMKRCHEFSYKCAETMQEIEFGQADTAPRKTQEVGRDHLIGKIAEVAFSKMLKRDFQKEVSLDFECYPRGKWDDHDMVLNGWRIDVKATKHGGQWMLIEWNKLDFRQKSAALPHLFTMAAVGWERGANAPTGFVELVGSAHVYRVKADAPNVRVFKKGECIPNTNVRLQADNFGIQFEHLEQDWNKVIKHILENAPPKLDLYPNPYTG